MIDITEEYLVIQVGNVLYFKIFTVRLKLLKCHIYVQISYLRPFIFHLDSVFKILIIEKNNACFDFIINSINSFDSVPTGNL